MESITAIRSFMLQAPGEVNNTRIPLYDTMTILITTLLIVTILKTLKTVTLLTTDFTYIQFYL